MTAKKTTIHTSVLVVYLTFDLSVDSTNTNSDCLSPAVVSSVT